MPSLFIYSVGHAVPSVPSENSGSMHEFSAVHAASQTDR